MIILSKNSQLSIRCRIKGDVGTTGIKRDLSNTIAGNYTPELGSIDSRSKTVNDTAPSYCDCIGLTCSDIYSKRSDWSREVEKRCYTIAIVFVPKCTCSTSNRIDKPSTPDEKSRS